MPITAQPNPVRIKRSAGTGTTTITWDTGGPAGRVWLSVNGGAETEFDPPAGNAPVRRGSAVLPVTLGATYALSLRNGVGAQLASVVVRTMPAVGETNADLPGAFADASRIAGNLGLVQQIRAVRVAPGATFADFSFSTTQPAVPIITVATSPPDSSGVFSPSDIVRTASLFFFGPRTQHRTQVTGLASGTTYFYTITAASTNPGDPPELSKGDFATGMRRAEVHFTVLWVHRDSDTLSRGDLAFYFAAYDGPLGRYLGPAPVLRYPRSGFASIGDGGSVSLTNEVVAIDDAPDTLTLWVYGEDDDSVDLFGGPAFRAALQPPSFAPPGKSHGQSDITQWSTAIEHFDLPSDLGGGGPFTFDFRLESATGGLWFTILGWVEVSFARAQMSRAPIPSFAHPSTAFAIDVGRLAAVAGADGRTEVVARGPDDAVYHKSIRDDANGTARHEWDDIGDGVGGPVTAISAADGRLHVLALTKEGAVEHKYRIGEEWLPSPRGWTEFGGRLKGPIAAAKTEDGRVELFALGLDDVLRHRALSGDAANPDGEWERIDGVVRGTIVAVASGTERIELFAFAPGEAVHHRTWDVRAGRPVQDAWETMPASEAPAEASPTPRKELLGHLRSAWDAPEPAYRPG